MKKIKILLLLRDLRVGNGVAACIMNYYLSMKCPELQIDFLLTRKKENPYVDEIAKKGGNVFILPNEKIRTSRDNKKYIDNLLDKNYDIVHVNITGIIAVLFLEKAKQHKIPVRIYHAHNPRETSSPKAWIRSILFEGLSVLLSNQYIACSSYAGKSIFGKRKFTIIPNAIDINEFAYDDFARIKYRDAYELNDKFVVGTVARIEEQKNPFFLIDIFQKIKIKKENAILFWVGDGSLCDAVQSYAKEKGIIENCIFVGSRSDVNKLYSIMDVFLLPSKFEGFGLVFLEAQISGLKCFGSDKVPKDVKVTDNMFFLELKLDAETWAMNILAHSDYDRRDMSSTVQKSEYNIGRASDKLEQLYLTRINNHS